MNRIDWCKKQKGGIELIEPNQNLCEEYFKKAENALSATKSLEGNTEWQISSAYYAMYFSLYAILMKAGVKCEIHKCTIEFMKQYLKKYFLEEEINLLQESNKARVDVQYYTDRYVTDEQKRTMVNFASKIYFKCREISITLSFEEITNIRNKL